MIAITTPSHSPRKHTPNLLPLRINHSGRIDNANQYFKPFVSKPSHPNADSAQPQTTPEETKHAYFRGRHLISTSLPIPSNYTGSILHFTSTPAEKPSSSSLSADQRARDEEEEQDMNDDDDDDHDDGMEGLETTTAHVLGTFDEVVLWGHAEKVDEDRDEFVRGVREWVGFAEGLHGD